MSDSLTSIAQNSKMRYGERLKKFGVAPQTLGWGCWDDQLTRFQVMVTQENFANKTVLDIGCGFADFYGYLKSQSISCQYIGVDIMDEFVKQNQETYPEAHFICCDFMSQPERLPQADYVVSNGTMNFKLEDNFSYTKKFLQMAFSQAREKLIVDFLSSVITSNYPKGSTVYYHSPNDILNIALDLTPNVRLIHDYAPIPQKEFMIILGR